MVLPHNAENAPASPARATNDGDDPSRPTGEPIGHRTSVSLHAPESPLARILATAAKKMRLDFEDSAYIEHRGSKGTVRETDVLNFLKKYLPDNVRAAGPADIVSVDGQTSGQMDIVIYDPSAPPLFDRGGYRILPAECVYAVIEVKSRLDARALRESAENIAKVKRMPKTSYFPQLFVQKPQLYGKEYDGHFPTFGYIFAFESNDL